MWFEEALRLVDAGDESVKRVPVMEYLASTYYDTGNYERSLRTALSILEMALEAIEQRSAQMTGLDMSTAESLQVGNYGFGGHYRPHWDMPLSNDAMFWHNIHRDGRPDIRTLYPGGVWTVARISRCILHPFFHLRINVLIPSPGTPAVQCWPARNGWQINGSTNVVRNGSGRVRSSTATTRTKRVWRAVLAGIDDFTDRIS
ncbi:unnamed protein product [Sphagnum balticum]